MSEMGETRATGGGMAVSQRVVVNSPANGKFVGTADLTEMERAFVKAFVKNGGNATQAAKTAGYSGDGRAGAQHCMKQPKIRAAIAEAIAQKIDTKGAAVGYAVLEEIATDKAAPPGVRARCARDLLELAGLYERHKKPENTGSNGKSLSEMTSEELEAVIAKGATVLRAAATKPPIEATATTVDAQDGAQMVDVTPAKPLDEQA